jgi:hypothetical protein
MTKIHLFNLVTAKKKRLTNNFQADRQAERQQQNETASHGNMSRPTVPGLNKQRHTPHRNKEKQKQRRSPPKRNENSI